VSAVLFRSVSLVLVSCVLMTSVAHADDTAVSRADRFFKDGRRAAEHGDFGEACKLFEESFRLDPGVGTLVNLGDCAEHLGDLERAYGYYHTASARMTEGDDRLARVHERLESIDRRAAKVALQLDADAPQGTVITLDGDTVDAHKMPLHLLKGGHIVLVTAVGYRGARYNLDVTEGEIRALHVTPGPALEAVLPGSIVQTEVRPSGWMKPASVSVLGLGVAAVWVGSLAGLMAIDRRDVQSANCNAQSVCNVMGVDAAHDGATWATVSTATFITGAVLLALGTTLFIVSLASKRRAAAVSMGGMSIGGHFE
jgi:hypothetical protein